ncbi:hypothetical protein JHK84_057068 [Glycine max]|nr:hypothetical protein JHK84_057068 [Glycine max]
MPALMKPINASSTSNSTARQSGKLIKLNKNNNDGKAYPIGVCTCFGLCAKCHCAVYLRHQQQLKSILLPHGTSLKHGFLKFNVDAASFEDQQHFGIGIYIRDNQAQFVKAKTIFLPGLPEPSERS